MAEQIPGEPTEAPDVISLNPEDYMVTLSGVIPPRSYIDISPADYLRGWSPVIGKDGSIGGHHLEPLGYDEA